MAVDPAPLVTIYIPTRNRPDFIQRAVNSCLAQTYRPIEIIVVDDGSEAEVQSQLQQFATETPQLKLLLNSTSVGASAARNQAIAVAQGEFITGLDDDDEFLPDRLSEFVSNWTGADSFLSSGYQFCTGPGQLLRSGRKALNISLSKLLMVNLVGNQIFTKTSYLRDIGGFDAGLVACQDYDVWIRLAQQFGSGRRLANFSYIVHQEHELERISNPQRRLAGHQQLIEKHRALWTPSQLRSQLFYRQLQSGQAFTWGLVPLAGWRNLGKLIKVLLVQWYQKKCS
jgi:glycosyltransferase involved in cell wall biosynthesis